MYKGQVRRRVRWMHLFLCFGDERSFSVFSSFILLCWLILLSVRSSWVNRHANTQDDENAEGEGTLKRMRGVPSGPSKVVHVKGVPADTQEFELKALASSFGTVIRCLILAPKHQAFVQMDSLESSGKLLSHFSSIQAFVRTTPVFLQYSSRTEITPNSRYANGGDGSVGAGGEGTPNVVLMITINNMRLPVTIDNIHQVFRTFGDVLRIGPPHFPPLSPLFPYFVLSVSPPRLCPLPLNSHPAIQHKTYINMLCAV